MTKVKKTFNGPALVIAMARAADPIFRKKIMAVLAEDLPVLAALVERFNFMFSDIARLDDRSVQVLLQKIPEEKWMLAWKLATPEVKERILANMSDRRREAFLGAAAGAPRVKKVAVCRVQFEIAQKAYRLMSEGHLRFAPREKMPKLVAHL